MDKTLHVFLVLFLGTLLFLPRFSLAQTELTVSIQVGDTILTLSGRTSPNAQVTVKENGSVLGTTTADSQGLFSKSLLAQDPGIHSIDLYAADSNNKTTSTVTYSVSLTLGTETTLSNIILPPTITLSGEGIAKGDNLKISGSAVPSSTVTIFINGTSHSYSTSKSTTSGSDGTWEYNFGTGDLALGDYKVEAKTSTTDGYQSESSEIKNFKIQTAPTTTTAPSSVTSTPTPTSYPGEVGPTPTSTPTLPSFLQPFDFDNSGHLEFGEIFGTVKLWVDLWRGKTSETCDLNKDKLCNIFDFSILLYYIGK